MLYCEKCLDGPLRPRTCRVPGSFIQGAIKGRMQMVKIRIPLPERDASGANAEWLWAAPIGNNTYALRNIPIFVFGLSYDDVVVAEPEGENLAFRRVIGRGGHSTYRTYSKPNRHDPKVIYLLEQVFRLGCDLEPATGRIVGVDVLPKTDGHAVYAALQKAEDAGILEFEEGHCGHPLRD